MNKTAARLKTVLARQRDDTTLMEAGVVLAVMVLLIAAMLLALRRARNGWCTVGLANAGKSPRDSCSGGEQLLAA